MKKIFFGLSLFMAFSLGSCIQDEPLNSECDIEQVSVVSENQDVLFFSPHDAVKIVPSASSNIVFYVREGFTDSTALEALRLISEWHKLWAEDPAADASEPPILEGVDPLSDEETPRE